MASPNEIEEASRPPSPVPAAPEYPAPLPDVVAAAGNTDSNESKGSKASVKSIELHAMTSATWVRDGDLEEAKHEHAMKRNASWVVVLGLAYRTLGVIYGDIATSPLYLWPSVFSAAPEATDVLGALCLIFWTLTIVTMFKYLFIVLAANDHGEGGTFALYSLLCRHVKISPFGPKHVSDEGLSRYSMPKARTPGEKRTVNDRVEDFIHDSPRVQQALLAIVVAGTCALIGDGIITPAVSVVSAVSGLQTPAALQHSNGNPKVSNGVVVGISCAILFMLFACQRYGTSKVGFTLSPIVVAWYGLNGGIGVYNIAKHYPAVFKALSPHYGIGYFLRNGKAGWISLGGVVLCITGTEAFFADLGHFSVRSVRLSALGIVYPSLICIYFGQAAYLIKNPGDIGKLYYNAIPHKLFWPTFVVALLAAIVASQAIITGSFSIIKQSMALNCFPRVTVRNTSTTVGGQIYIDEVNWALCALGIAIICGFTLPQKGTSVDTVGLSNAYGVAVLTVMVITTFLVTLAILVVWRRHVLFAIAFFAVFMFIEGIYFSSTLYKIPHGAWFPIVVAVAVFSVSYLWHWGTTKRLAYSAAHGVQLDDVLAEEDDDALTPHALMLKPLVLKSSGQPVLRASGGALYYADNLSNLPPAFLKLLRDFPTVHDVSVFLTVRQVPVPRVDDSERLLVREMNFSGFYRVVARYGYMDEVDQGAAFVTSVFHALETFLHAKTRALRRSGVGFDIVDVPTGGLALDLSKITDPNLELQRLAAARNQDVVYVRSRSRVVPAPGSSFVKRGVLEAYSALVAVSRSPIASAKMPFDALHEVGISYYV